MARINLLPWREELRKQKQQEFGIIAISSVVIAGLIVLLAHLHVDGLINDQNQRNAYLESEISILNKRIGRIRELEAMKDNLLARMNVIQELQGSRPESVHLMDELVRTLPEGVHLNTFQQKNRALTMTGIAESNARVSDYMRQIDTSEWFTGPRLDVIKTSEANRRRIANFTLRGSQKTQQPAEDTAKATP
ncbi:MAG: PilN domain-containing protein [Gammaproteobacteria bacterium]|jgi:type IV pilus assembly protein PilN|nr:PilN domain-containing protein [Gammaproteobacteria bacterium]